MRSIVVVGSGIIGLSVAEFLSRTEKNVIVISNNDPMSGSFAAAANLATKGQLYGRDPHFQMKLDSKQEYRQWLVSLLKEDDKGIFVEDMFQQGLGVDWFYSEEQRNRHLHRVMQSKDELCKRNLPLDYIRPVGVHKIVYQNEAWVDGRALLHLLKRVLEKRGVSFVFEDFFNDALDRYSVHPDVHVIFCTGAWTKGLLLKLGIPVPERMQKQEKITIGSTFYGEDILDQYHQDYALQEIVSFDMKNKVTFSGTKKCQYMSSSSVQVETKNKSPMKFDFDDFLLNFLGNENSKLIEFSSEKKESFCIYKKNKNLNKLTGIRVRYGHSEIVLEKILFNKINIIVCCGAHKSGFLFANHVGKSIHKMLCS